MGDATYTLPNIGASTPAFTGGNTNANIDGRAFHTMTPFKDVLIVVGGVNTNSGTLEITGQVLSASRESRVHSGVPLTPEHPNTRLPCSRIVVPAPQSTAEPWSPS